jgi:hypothetical protein
MNRPQRIVAVIYCLLVVYCCIWIPWHVEFQPATRAGYKNERVGYGWLWAGPYRRPAIVYNPPKATDDNWELVGVEEERSKYPSPLASPDLPLIQLRLVASTAIGLAVFLLFGLWKSATR